MVQKFVHYFKLFCIYSNRSIDLFLVNYEFYRLSIPRNIVRAQIEYCLLFQEQQQQQQQ